MADLRKLVRQYGLQKTKIRAGRELVWPPRKGLTPSKTAVNAFALAIQGKPSKMMVKVTSGDELVFASAKGKVTTPLNSLKLPVEEPLIETPSQPITPDNAMADVMFSVGRLNIAEERLTVLSERLPALDLEQNPEYQALKLELDTAQSQYEQNLQVWISTQPTQVVEPETPEAALNETEAPVTEDVPEIVEPIAPEPERVIFPGLDADVIKEVLPVEVLTVTDPLSSEPESLIEPSDSQVMQESGSASEAVTEVAQEAEPVPQAIAELIPESEVDRDPVAEVSQVDGSANEIDPDLDVAPSSTPEASAVAEQNLGLFQDAIAQASEPTAAQDFDSIDQSNELPDVGYSEGAAIDENRYEREAFPEDYLVDPDEPNEAFERDVSELEQDPLRQTEPLDRELSEGLVQDATEQTPETPEPNAEPIPLNSVQVVSEEVENLLSDKEVEQNQSNEVKESFAASDRGSSQEASQVISPNQSSFAQFSAIADTVPRIEPNPSIDISLPTIQPQLTQQQKNEAAILDAIRNQMIEAGPSRQTESPLSENDHARIKYELLLEQHPSYQGTTEADPKVLDRLVTEMAQQKWLDPDIYTRVIAQGSSYVQGNMANKLNPDAPVQISEGLRYLSSLSSDYQRAYIDRAYQPAISEQVKQILQYPTDTQSLDPATNLKETIARGATNIKETTIATVETLQLAQKNLGTFAQSVKHRGLKAWAKDQIPILRDKAAQLLSEQGSKIKDYAVAQAPVVAETARVIGSKAAEQFERMTQLIEPHRVKETGEYVISKMGQNGQYAGNVFAFDNSKGDLEITVKRDGEIVFKDGQLNPNLDGSYVYQLQRLADGVDRNKARPVSQKGTVIAEGPAR